MVGSLYSATAGWLMIPTLGWRLFLLATSLPGWLSAGLCAAFMPESPRYLLVQGQATEALQVRLPLLLGDCRYKHA